VIEYGARLDHAKDGHSYRVLCGNPACPANLGMATKSQAVYRLAVDAWWLGVSKGQSLPMVVADDEDAVQLTLPDGRTVGPPNAEWVVQHRWGLRWDGEAGAYRVIRPEQEEGKPKTRRRSAHRIPLSLAGVNGRVPKDRLREIRGQFPFLPARILCDRCGAVNVAEPPPVAAQWHRVYRQK
jgi:hypothetical protein